MRLCHTILEKERLLEVFNLANGKSKPKEIKQLSQSHRVSVSKPPPSLQITLFSPDFTAPPVILMISSLVLLVWFVLFSILKQQEQRPGKEVTSVLAFEVWPIAFT